MNSSSILNSEPALPPAPVPFPADARERERLRAQMRAEEWAVRQEVLATARTILAGLLANPQKPTVADLARLLDLASTLGRNATEEPDAASGYDGTEIMFEFRAALKRVYDRRQAAGKSLPDGAVIDAEVVPDPAGNAPVSGAAVGVSPNETSDKPKQPNRKKRQN
jgi:hypothetical protein